MRKTILVLGLAAVAAVFAQGKTGMIGDYVKTLQNAKTLKATYTVGKVGDEPAQYSIQLSKPNMVRFESDDTLIVADGKTVTTLNKKDNTYFKDPQTEDWAKTGFNNESVFLFQPFFNGDALKDAKVNSTTPKKRLGMELTAVEAQLDAKSGNTGTFFLDGKMLPRQLELFYKSENARVLVSAKDLEVDGTLDSSAFAFAAPAGSKELTAEERNADKWFTDLDEAKKIAAATGKLLLIDFMAEW